MQSMEPNPATVKGAGLPDFDESTSRVTDPANGWGPPKSVGAIGNDSPGWGRRGGSGSLAVCPARYALDSWVFTQASPRMSSAPFSPIIMAGALVLPEVNVGMIEASTTRRNSIPRTLSSASTTAIGSGPILQVPTG